LLLITIEVSILVIINVGFVDNIAAYPVIKAISFRSMKHKQVLLNRNLPKKCSILALR
jgi:hypothetical protein